MSQAPPPNHGLTVDDGRPGWDGPYLPRGFKYGDNPFDPAGFWYGVILYNNMFGASNFDLDGDGVIDRNGDGNHIAFLNVPESVAKKINDMYDADVPGDWKHTGKVEYWIAGTIAVRFYLIGGT